MPPTITPPERDNNAIRTASGIVLPPTVAASMLAAPVPPPGPVLSGILERMEWGQAALDGWQYGLRVAKDESFGFLRIPPKGSGLDDLLNAALVDGRIANIGISPIVSGQISAVLNRQMAQARNSEITLAGKKSPVNKAKAAISWYNDSPLGYTGAISQVVYQMRTFNRGAPHALVPIVYPLDQWDTYGMTPVPLDEKRGLYYLEVDWAKMGAPVPFLPSVFDLEPTGDREWPYWYKFCPDGKTDSWLLLHNSQIISIIPGHSEQPLIGTCSAYLCWDWLTEYALEKQRRAEKLVHEPTNGILLLSGITQTPADVKKQITTGRQIDRANGRQVDKGFTVFTGKDSMDGKLIDFREAFADFERLKQHVEDMIAQYFEEPLVSVVSRGNVGFGVQSETAAQNAADAGISAILNVVGMALGAMYPKVQISLSRPNDMAKQRQLTNMTAFAGAVGALPEGTLTRDEIRALFDANIMPIPQTGTDTMQQSGTADDATGASATGENQADAGDTGLAAAVDAMLLEAWRLQPITPRGSDRPLPANEPDSANADYEAFYADFPEYDGMLDAEPSDEADPQKDEEADTTAWLWLAVRLYFRLQDGYTVDRTETLATRDDLATLRQAHADTLAEQLAAGEITLQQWLDRIQGATESAYTTEYLLGRGGDNAMADDDYTWLDGTLTPVFGVLADLAGRIGQGLYSQAQIANFTRNTIGGATMGYEAGNAAAFGVDPNILPAMPTQDSECGPNCHCSWSHELDGDGNWVASYWTHPPITHRVPDYEPCPTCEWRLNNWNPWTPPSSRQRNNSAERSATEMQWTNGKAIGLTDAEIRVSRLLAQGLDRRAIAKQLVVSPRTVESHERNIREKLDAGNRTAAALKLKGLGF